MGGGHSRIKKSDGTGPAVESASTRARERRKVDKKEIVLKRLRKHRDLSLTPEDLEQMALDLSDKERMKRRFFRDIQSSAQEAVMAVGRESRDRNGEIRNQKEQKSFMTAVAREAYQLKTIEVQLALCTLRTRRLQYVVELIHKYVKHFDYGAFHAAIIINGIVLEWNDGNLVIPRPASQTQWTFCSSVHSHDQGSMAAVLGEPVPPRAGATETNQHFERIIEKIKDICTEKEILIDTLVEVAVRYNTKHEYGILSNNCQHFVGDCLRVIGGTEDRFPFEGQVKELVELLVKDGTRNTITDDFATHEELDAYVTEHLSEMTVEDMKYCICLYHLFHAFREAPECDELTCQLKILETKLEQSRIL